MYRLMKSKQVTLDHPISGLMSSYRQIQVAQFQKFGAALRACEVANNKGTSRHYVLNEMGEEYYDGAWID